MHVFKTFVTIYCLATQPQLNVFKNREQWVCKSKLCIVAFFDQQRVRCCPAQRKALLQFCNRKTRAAYAQSFTLWQQATIEITRHDHSITACSCHIYIWVLFFAHIPFVVNRTFTATPTERLQQHQTKGFRLETPPVRVLVWMKLWKIQMIYSNLLRIQLKRNWNRVWKTYQNDCHCFFSVRTPDVTCIWCVFPGTRGLMWSCAFSGVISWIEYLGFVWEAYSSVF